MLTLLYFVSRLNTFTKDDVTPVWNYLEVRFFYLTSLTAIMSSQSRVSLNLTDLLLVHVQVKPVVCPDDQHTDEQDEE